MMLHRRPEADRKADRRFQWRAANVKSAMQNALTCRFSLKGFDLNPADVVGNRRRICPAQTVL